MKKTINTCLMALLAIPMFIGCNPENSAERILTNQDFRKEIFKKIAENPEYMQEFATTSGMMEGEGMMAHDTMAMMDMMKENPQMMENMMRSMIQMCEKDTSMCSLVAEEMTENPKMMKHLEKHIHQNGTTKKEESMMNGHKMKR